MLYYNGIHGHTENNMNFGDHGMAGYGGLGVQAADFPRPASDISNQGSDNGGYGSSQMPMQSPAYDGSPTVYQPYNLGQQNYQQNHQLNSPQESYSLSQEPSPIFYQSGFPQQQQQQLQLPSQQVHMGVAHSSIQPLSELHQRNTGLPNWPPPQQQQPQQQPHQRLQISIAEPQQPLNSRNADHTGHFCTGSFGSASPQGYTPAGVGTPGSIGFPLQAQALSGGRQPSYTPDMDISRFGEPETMFMGGGMNLFYFDSSNCPDTPASQPPVDLDSQMPIPSHSSPYPLTTVDDVVNRDTMLQSAAANHMVHIPQDRLPVPTGTHLSGRRPSCSTVESDNSYANIRLHKSNSLQATIPSALHSTLVSALPLVQPPTSTVFMRAEPISPSLERGANKSAIPPNQLNSFKMNTRKKRREADMEPGPSTRRQKRDAKRACISCYLTRKKCEGGTPCSKCRETVSCGSPGSDEPIPFPQCFSSRFEDQNIFLQCLPEALKQRVAEITTKPEWKATRADKLVHINLDPALEVLSMEKLGHTHAYEQSVERIKFERDAVFGPMYKVCLLLQARHVLKKNTEGSTFRYTADFENDLMVLRAISAHRVFHMVEHRMEKNKIGSTVQPGSRRACILTTILGMLLEQTLGFHNSLPTTAAPDKDLEESRRQLAYHLAHRLLFMAKRALKETNQSVDKYIQIGNKLGDIKVDSKLWAEINEAHNLHDTNDAHAARGGSTLHAGENGCVSANSNTPLSTTNTPSINGGAGGSPGQNGNDVAGLVDAGGSSQYVKSCLEPPQVVLRSSTWEGSTVKRLDVPNTEQTQPRRGRKGGEDLAEFDDDREKHEVRAVNLLMMAQDVPIADLMAGMSLGTYPGGVGIETPSSQHNEEETRGGFDFGTQSGAHLSEDDGDGLSIGGGVEQPAGELSGFQYNPDANSTMGQTPDFEYPLISSSADSPNYGEDNYITCGYATPSDIFADSDHGNEDLVNQTWNNSSQNPAYQANYDVSVLPSAEPEARGSPTLASDSIPRTINPFHESPSSSAANTPSCVMSLRRHISKSQEKGKGIVSGFLTRSHSRSGK